MAFKPNLALPVLIVVPEAPPNAAPDGKHSLGGRAAKVITTLQ
jgi:hypothetical protein